MTKMTQYTSNERCDPTLITMKIPSLGMKEVTYEKYINLVTAMGLKRDPEGSFWVGGWPVFMLPNGNPFMVAIDFN